jgi:hypothetical protein
MQVELLEKHEDELGEVGFLQEDFVYDVCSIIL